MCISLIYITLITILVICVCSDLISLKIPNKVILLGIVLGLITQLINNGINGLLIWFTGILAPIMLLFILFAVGILGAGDVKLFSVVGSFLGMKLMFKSLIIAFVIGAIISLVKLISNKNLFYRLQYLANYIRRTIKSKKIDTYYTVEESNKNIIHFSIAIFIGVVITIFT